MKPDVFWFSWNLFMTVFWIVQITVRLAWFKDWQRIGKSTGEQGVWIAASVFFFLFSTVGLFLNSGIFVR